MYDIRYQSAREMVSDLLVGVAIGLFVGGLAAALVAHSGLAAWLMGASLVASIGAIELPRTR